MKNRRVCHRPTIGIGVKPGSRVLASWRIVTAVLSLIYAERKKRAISLSNLWVKTRGRNWGKGDIYKSGWDVRESRELNGELNEVEDSLIC
jgi:hypothetical protein